MKRRLALTVAILIAVLCGTVAVIEVRPWHPHARTPRFDGWQLDDRWRAGVEFPHLTLQFHRDGTLWATRYADVFCSDDLGESWHRTGRLCARQPGLAASLRHALASSDIARALHGRQGIETLIVLDSGTVLAHAGACIYRSGDAGHTFEVVHTLRQQPERKRILRHWAEDDDGTVWYGEYGPERRADSRIVRGTDDGRLWETALTLPRGGEPGGVRHIHGVQSDPYSGKLWLTTGDRSDESYIGTIEGTVFVPAGGGSRDWTAVSLLFGERAISWGTDDPSGTNAILRHDRASGETRRIAEIGGPAYFSASLADGSHLVATVIEGVGEEEVELWISDDSLRWRRIARIPPFDDPDRRLRGTLGFPLGDPLPVVAFNVVRLGATERSAFVAR